MFVSSFWKLKCKYLLTGLFRFVWSSSTFIESLDKLSSKKTGESLLHRDFISGYKAPMIVSNPGSGFNALLDEICVRHEGQRWFVSLKDVVIQE